MKTDLSIYLFFRGNDFYHVWIKNDVDAVKNAECNEGTTKVTTLGGKVVWTK